LITIIRNGEVYSPEYLGKKDIVIAGGRIETIADHIRVDKAFLDVKVVDAEGKIVFPGFIDSHVHILGGGGEGGYHTRTPEIHLAQLLEGGITTVVGCLGTDGICRDIKSLLAKAAALEEEGITARVYTGSYHIPVGTVTGSIREDIMLIDKIIGVGEVALSDHRSSQPTFEEFIRVVSDARVGGLLSGKAGIVNVHIGDGRSGIDYLEKMAEETELPLSQVIPTHMNRNHSIFKKAMAYAQKGGLVDLTTSMSAFDSENEVIRCSKGLKEMLEAGVPIRNITFSSDGQGSLPLFDMTGRLNGLGVGSVKSLYGEVRDVLLEGQIAIEQAIRVITSNVADNLALHSKGRIREGLDADLVTVDKKDFHICHVFAKGQVMVEEGKVVHKSIVV